ncbi:DUF4224 domain-containing protein [Pseudomonas turukhanskensis]|uniref:DUF4224 domain-containing protein n=1 Tax=Pseudomonas turukhanskensis TaxID=1806536 RepID=A0A9W6K2M1_9PSED|nr:hypothetical protein GCM10017655_13980 [Pseudomonas turukhanskensis]
MTGGRLLSFEDLQRTTGYTRRSDIERSLRSQGIRFFYGRNVIWTTVDLVNYAGGLRPNTDDKYGPEILGDAPKKEPQLRLGKARSRP